MGQAQGRALRLRQRKGAGAVLRVDQKVEQPGLGHASGRGAPGDPGERQRDLGLHPGKARRLQVPAERHGRPCAQSPVDQPGVRSVAQPSRDPPQQDHALHRHVRRPVPAAASEVPFQGGNLPARIDGTSIIPPRAGATGDALDDAPAGNGQQQSGVRADLGQPLRPPGPRQPTGARDGNVRADLLQPAEEFRLGQPLAQHMGGPQCHLLAEHRDDPAVDAQDRRLQLCPERRLQRRGPPSEACLGPIPAKARSRASQLASAPCRSGG